MIDFLKEKVDLFVQLLVPCLRGEITIKISETPKKFMKNSRFKTRLNFCYTDSMLCHPLVYLFKALKMVPSKFFSCPSWNIR